MGDHWTVETIHWDRFDRSKLDPDIVRLIKAAAMVEYNARDYVGYLKQVFRGNADIEATLDRWGDEEVQHGKVLGRWAELADPSFRFEEAFARFRKGYRPAHFENAAQSVRGSQVGELVARCVVESGTSSTYTAIRDATGEPVLKQITGLIAADEFKHYRTFTAMIDQAPKPKPGLLGKLRVAVGRMAEVDDDELAFAYYCANVSRGEAHDPVYDRKLHSREYQSAMMTVYRAAHAETAAKMIGRAAGLPAGSAILGWAARAFWRHIDRHWRNGKVAH